VKKIIAGEWDTEDKKRRLEEDENRHKRKIEPPPPPREEKTENFTGSNPTGDEPHSVMP